MRTYYQKFKDVDPEIREAQRMLCCLPDIGNLVVVLGGDGTMVKAIKELGPSYSFMGINFGNLGFLMNTVGRDMDSIRRFILDGEWQPYKFPRVGMFTDTGIQDVGLNDAYIERDGDATAHLRILVNGIEIVERQSADGLIVATSIGSTGYNRSAGGPLMHPLHPGFCLTPICPHLPTLRPLVLPPDALVEVDIIQPEWRPVKVTVDGRSHKREGEVYIRKVTIGDASPVSLVFPKDHKFLQTMVRKDLLR